MARCRGQSPASVPRPRQWLASAPASSRRVRRVLLESVTGLRAIEQVEPLADDFPFERVALKRDAARQGDRVVTRELRRIDLRIRGEGGQVSLVAEAKNAARVREFEIGPASRGLRLGKIGHGVVTGDRYPGVIVRNNRGRRCDHWQGQQNARQQERDGKLPCSTWEGHIGPRHRDSWPGIGRSGRRSRTAFA